MESAILSNDLWLQWGAVLGASLVAGFTDSRTRRIPNTLTGSLLLAGLAHAFLITGPAGLGTAVLSALLVSLPFGLLFVFAGGGAGDAKLMAGVGAWLGLANGALALATVALSGVLLAFIWGWAHTGLRQLRGRLAVVAWGLLAPVLGTASWHESSHLLTDVEDDQKMPYGLAIFVGIAVAFSIRALG